MALSLTGCNPFGFLYGECTSDSVPPGNVAAAAGDASVTITWELPVHDTLDADEVRSLVQYDPSGGEGSQCNTYDPNAETPGCVQACRHSLGTGCVITGLVNDRTYVFTVITVSRRSNPGCSSGIGFARSEPVTPRAN